MNLKKCYPKDIKLEKNIVMALPRQKNREIVLQLLFSNHFYEIEKEEFISFMMNLLKITKKNIKIAFDEATQILKKITHLDDIIKRVSKDYKFERISKMELNILRLALYEIHFNDNIPKNVAIAEAMRLAKKFGSSQSFKFINAILDAQNEKLLVNEI